MHIYTIYSSLDGAVNMIYIQIILFYGRRKPVDTVGYFLRMYMACHLPGKLGDFEASCLRSLFL